MKRLEQISETLHLQTNEKTQSQQQNNMKIQHVLPEITQIPVFQYREYNGEFTKYLKDNQLQYNDIYQYYSQYHDSFSKHISYYHTELRKNLQIFDIHEVFFKKQLMENIILQEYDINTSIKYGQIALIFKANIHAQGHMNKYHGGLTATIIDDIMGKMCMLVTNNDMVATIELNTKYKGPLNIGQEYIALNKVIDINDKNIILQCDIMNINQQVLVTATGTFRKLATTKNPNFQALEEFYLRKMYKNLPNVASLIKQE